MLFNKKNKKKSKIINTIYISAFVPEGVRFAIVHAHPVCDRVSSLEVE